MNAGKHVCFAVAILAAAVVYVINDLNRPADGIAFSYNPANRSDNIPAMVLFACALLITLYQLHLQRVHSEKLRQPLGEIDLAADPAYIRIRLFNKGAGPLILDELIFAGQGRSQPDLNQGLPPECRTDRCVSDSDEITGKSILPGRYLVIFRAELRADKNASVKQVWQELSQIKMKVVYHDIYNNRFTIERNFGDLMPNDKSVK